MPTAAPPPPIAQLQPRTILEIDPALNTLTLLAPRYAPKDITSTFDPALVALLVDPKNQLVTASDASEWWSGDIVGSIVDKRTTQVLADISAAGTSITIRGKTGQQCNPITQVCLDPVVAVSGRFEELVVFGEQPGAVRVRHIDTGVEELRVIKGDIPNPVAATYRAQDDAYYVLTHKAGNGAIEILRLDRDGTIHSVMKLHSFRKATDFALTTGWEGSLVFSAWSSKRHLVAVIALPEGGGRPRIARVIRGADPLGLAAYSDFRGIYIARKLAGIEQAPEWLPPPKIGKVDDDDDDGDFDDKGP